MRLCACAERKTAVLQGLTRRMIPVWLSGDLERRLERSAYRQWERRPGLSVLPSVRFLSPKRPRLLAEMEAARWFSSGRFFSFQR